MEGRGESGGQGRCGIRAKLAGRRRCNHAIADRLEEHATVEVVHHGEVLVAMLFYGGWDNDLGASSITIRA